MKTKFLTDAERVRLRKMIEQREWYPKWQKNLSAPEALLDLWRRWHRVGLVELSAFQRFKREHGFYDKDKASDDLELD